MSDHLPEFSGPADEILDQFVSIVTESTPATVGIVLSSFFGYGISFVLLDYRRATVRPTHFLLHVVLGIGYSATIFAIVNLDLLTHNLTIEQITTRMPITLVVSFIVAFILIFGGMIWRERSSPYAAPNDRGDE